MRSPTRSTRRTRSRSATATTFPRRATGSVHHRRRGQHRAALGEQVEREALQLRRPHRV